MTTQQMIDQIEDNCQALANAGALTSGQYQQVDQIVADQQAIDLCKLELLAGALSNCRQGICQIQATFRPKRP